jgi:hypothetical protein
MKPSEAFLGVIDFFSTLVPGAVAAFLLLNQQLFSLPSGWLRWPLIWASTEGWVVFAVSAYLLGHAIVAVGSFLLDGPLYDRWYVRWQRSPRNGSSPARLSLRAIGLSSDNERVMSGERRILTIHCFGYQRSSRICSFEI